MSSPPDNFSQLPLGWANPLLCEVAQVNPPLDRCIIDDDLLINFVPMRAVEPEGRGLLRPETRLFREVKKGYTPFLSGDVIMAKITPCMENGKTTVVPRLEGDLCFGSTEFHVIRPENGISANWIANFLLRHDVRRSAQRHMSGGVGQMRVPVAFLENIHIPIPPAREIQLINDALDELLSDLDAALEALERTRKKLDLYRASILRGAVEGTLTAEWRAQHPNTESASDLLNRILAERRRLWEEEQLRTFKAKGKEPTPHWREKYREPVSANIPPSALPKGWCGVTLDQILWRLRGGTPQTSQNEITDYPVLKSSAVRHGFIDYKDLNFLPKPEVVRPDNYLQEGDFLITRLSGSVNYVGCTAVVKEREHHHIQYPDRIFCGKIVPGIQGNYLTYCFQHPEIRKTIEEAAKSTAGHQRISLSDLYPLVIRLPPQAEQEIIVEAVEDQISVIDHLDADLATKLTRTEALRQSILQQAFSGHLVPQDPNDESACELLKRIAFEREERARAVIIKQGPVTKKTVRKKQTPNISAKTSSVA